MIKHFSRLLALLALALPLAAQAQAPRLSEILQAEMRPGWQTERGTHIAALHLKLARNWITYWRHPGESGIAPRIDWSGSGNLAGVVLHWPEPRLYDKAGFQSIGYADELILPVEITPAQAGRDVTLRGVMTLGVCADICIPVDLPIHLVVNGAGAHDRQIAAALSHQPRSARVSGLQSVSCTTRAKPRGLRLSATMRIPPTGQNEFMLIEIAGTQARVRVLPSRRDGDVITGEILLRDVAGIDRESVRLTLVSDSGALEHQGCSLGAG